MLLTPYKNLINTTQAQYKGTPLEVEVRYGTFDPKDGRFKAGISIQTFSRLQNELSKITPPVQTKSYDEVADNIRHTILETGESFWIEKKRILTRDIKEYGMRLAVSTENPISPPPDFNPKISREKHRFSYLIAGGVARVDMTRITTNGRVSHEIEMELIKPQPQAFDVFANAAKLVLKIVQDTTVLYTQEEKREVTSYFNNLLSTGRNRHKDVLDHSILAQARNLKIRDMVWGGLIGGQETGYVVSNKADGQRKILLFAPNGVWLLLPPFEYTRLTDISFPAFTGTALDGELIPKEKRKSQAPTKNYWYLIFDTIAWQGDLGAHQQPHNDRMQLAQTLTNTLQSPVIELTTMSFYSFNTPDKFFEVMRRMFDRQETLSYVQDGFMFRPETIAYNPSIDAVDEEGRTKKVSVDSLPLFERVLTNYPDNCKWKPPSEMTIDFLIRRSQDGRLGLYVNKDGKPILFTGSRLNPFSGYIDIPIILEDVSDENIVEMKWEEGEFIPTRVRIDKTKPNREEIAIDVWDDIRHPISEELLRGRTLDLFNYYQNRVRKGLLSGKGENLLELNPGKGGDVGRWKRYKRILILEEDAENIEELTRRIQLNRLDGKVRVISRREDLQRESDSFLGKADVISLIKNAGIFWQSEEDLNYLVGVINGTLSPSGEIVYFILDGDAVEEMFSPVFTPELKLDRLELDTLTLSYPTEENKLFFNYKGEEYQDREEAPVFIWNLLQQLPGYNIQEVHRCDTEVFLTPSAKILGRLYSFGRISRGIERRALGIAQGQGNNPLKSKVMGRGEIPSSVAKRPESVTSPKPVGAPVVMVTPTTLSARKNPVPIKRRGIRRATQLRNLFVKAPRNLSRPGIGDDKSEKLIVTWTQEEVYRIACIGDGSCFFHAYLKGFYEPYQNNNAFEYRTRLAREFRDNLASLLYEEDLDAEGKTYYETIGDGIWVEMAEQQKMANEPFLDEFNEPIDFSQEGMAQLLLGGRDVGDEVYTYVTEITGMGVYVFRGTTGDIYPQVRAGSPDFPQVVIVGTGNHYELIAVKRDGLFQTVFSPNDPFSIEIRENRPKL